jgi:hypothetical protein
MSASDGYGKAAHAYKSSPYTATHYPHRAFGRVNTADPSPDDRAVQSSLGWLIMALPQYCRFLGIALYGFLQCQLILILSHLFWQIRPPELGSPDCSCHL